MTLTGATFPRVQWPALLAAVALMVGSLAVMVAVAVPLALVLVGRCRRAGRPS